MISVCVRVHVSMHTHIHTHIHTILSYHSCTCIRVPCMCIVYVDGVCRVCRVQTLPKPPCMLWASRSVNARPAAARPHWLLFSGFLWWMLLLLHALHDSLSGLSLFMLFHCSLSCFSSFTVALSCFTFYMLFMRAFWFHSYISVRFLPNTCPDCQFS